MDDENEVVLTPDEIFDDKYLELHQLVYVNGMVGLGLKDRTEYLPPIYES